MEQFPKMLYQAPGPVQLEDGGYQTLIVADEAQLDAALADGWHEDPKGAKAALEAEKAVALTASVGGVTSEQQTAGDIKAEAPTPAAKKAPKAKD